MVSFIQHMTAMVLIPRWLLILFINFVLLSIVLTFRVALLKKNVRVNSEGGEKSAS